MILRVKKSTTNGKIRIPGSKSHTIRALFIASLASGRSEIYNPLISDDALSAVKVLRALGAKIETSPRHYSVDGFGGVPQVPEDIIDVGNSGTTLRFAVMAATLIEGYSVFTGDYQIRRRPLGSLLDAVNNLGGVAFATRNNGMAPVVIKGRASGGETPLDSFTSQYISSVLINAPLMEKDTRIIVSRLNEV